ncbi:MAG: hypothetical protein OSB00_10495 [Sphingomonas bacterium]|nr:hypothetical protein [Sphingomonas bacterium]
MRLVHAFSLLAIGVCGFASTGTSAWAAEENATKSLDELVTCKAIVIDAQRLSCFDRVSGKIVTARASGELLALDRQKVVANKRRSFGLSNQADAPLGERAVDKAIAVTQVDTTISGVRQSGYGRYRLDLANDTSWQTIDPPTLEPRVGAAITVKRASLGGFRATIAGGRSILVKRVR